MTQRFAFLLLISLSVALMLLGKVGNPFTERLRTVISDAAAPVLSVIAHPVAAVDQATAEVSELISMREENARLREENARLRAWEVVARGLEQENAAFRAMLDVGAESEMRQTVTARVIGDSGGPFVRTLLLDAGQRKGVGAGQAAVTGEGLVGRIVEAGARSSRILMLTDLNSRVPVVIESTRYRAVLAGDNSDQARLIFLSTGGRIRPGDRIATSGHGGMFPPGLPVGVVTSVADGVPRVQPFVNWHRLEYVRILQLHRPGAEEAQAKEDPAGLW
jgi:rod shape-determining protein MreC